MIDSDGILWLHEKHKEGGLDMDGIKISFRPWKT